MKLVGITDRIGKVDFLRDLTGEEIAQHRRFTPIVVEAESRLRLFQILSLNFREWTEYINKLLVGEVGKDEDGVVQLDRLLLNYLACAYTLREHFEVSFQRRYRKDLVEKKKYDEFLNRLCEHSWAFAFFLDFRGYVQHCGLGIQRFNRNAGMTRVTLTITQNAAKLVAESRQWKRSKLKGTEGTLHLVPLLREFNHQMLSSYAGFVVRTFMPELIPASEFYGRLAEEVKSKGSNYRMAFLKRKPVEKIQKGKTQLKFTLVMVANDVFRELGIEPFLGKQNHQQK